MRKWLEIFRQRVRWIPSILLVAGLAVEVGLVVVAFKLNMDWLYLAILIGPVLFTPPPFLALLGAIVEKSVRHRVLHIVVSVVGGLLAALSYFALSALAEKTAREFVLRRMHGL